MSPDPNRDPEPRPDPPAHHNAPCGTSDVAARRIAGHAPTQRSRVLMLIYSRGAEGLTDDEGEAALAMRPQSYTPRRRELVQLGQVVDSGRRRRTESGRPAAVWIAADFAELAKGSGEGVER